MNSCALEYNIETTCEKNVEFARDYYSYIIYKWLQVFLAIWFDVWMFVCAQKYKYISLE